MRRDPSCRRAKARLAPSDVCGLEDTDRILRPRAPRGSRQGAAAIDRGGRLTKCLVVDDQRRGDGPLPGAGMVRWQLG